MKTLPRAITRVIDSFDKLPGIGPKTAARLAFYLLHVPQDQLESFASSLSNLKKNTILCSTCFNIGETDPCSICSDAERSQESICVVEQPLDIIIIEKTAQFKGLYHVLHGAISPLNNIGPHDIYIPQLLERLAKGGVTELMLATNPTMEGEATAMYIKEGMKRVGLTVPITRLAHGLPIGADLEYADEITVRRAIEGRREF